MRTHDLPLTGACPGKAIRNSAWLPHALSIDDRLRRFVEIRCLAKHAQSRYLTPLFAAVQATLTWMRGIAAHLK